MLKKTITQISIVAIIIGCIFIANGLILAWTAPGSTPPDGNASAPINISGTSQTKSGTLISGTDMRAPIFYDQNNTGYYVNPDSNSWLYRLYSYDLRSDIYYDRNDTGYYVDPASTSRMNAITPNSITLGGVNRTTWPTAVAEADTLDTVANRGNTTSNWIQSNSSMRAPLFYDSNNTGYYVDPAGSSRMNTLYYVDQAYIVDVRPQYMYDWNDSAYYIDMNSGSRLNYLGRNYGWNWTEYDWNDTSYYMDLNQTSRLNRLDFRYGYDMDNTGYYIDLNNTTRANEIQANRVYGFSDIRSPIFYDYNNTGYYVDPASTSRINYGVFDNVYSYGWMQAPIFYDSNNNGYYLDPASTSVLNAVYANGFYYNSDENLKKNIQVIPNALEKILNLEGVAFDWKENGLKSMGLTAQNVEKEFPELVSEDEKTGLKSVQYGNLVAPIIEAIKELTAKLGDLASRVDNMFKKIVGHDSRIEELERNNQLLQQQIDELKNQIKIIN